MYLIIKRRSRNYNSDEFTDNVVLKITSISGNIFHDKKFESLRDADLERLKISRSELEKNRIRRVTDRGTDVGILLEPGTMLHNGDILNSNEKTIVIEQIPEKVIAIKVKNNQSPELFILIGHIIGNRHRPISIENNMVFFPIHADSEIDVFEKLFAEVIDKIELTVEEKIFKPHTGANVHDHG